MQSDTYGDMTTMLKAIRVATPAGLLVTRPVPTSSTGPSVLGMMLGSEGRLGVITEAVVQIRPLPAVKKVLGYFFPDWSRGLAAMEAIAVSEAAPLFTRLADAEETAFSLATSKGRPSVALKALNAYLEKIRRYRLDQLCLSFIGFEGSAHHVELQQKLVDKIVRVHGGVELGPKPGALYDQKKFDTPYIRDFLLDRDGYGDVSETSAPWSRLPGLYDAVATAAGKAFADLGVQGLLMCHLSHAEAIGACLYFTFAFRPTSTHDPLGQYDAVKSAIQQAFIDNGATLSHHHAVGLEHARWLADDISAQGVQLIRALFTGIDPRSNLNPGKITG
jgi:alkyldihydroxyacetonephosphate synthase